VEVKKGKSAGRMEKDGGEGKGRKGRGWFENCVYYPAGKDDLAYCTDLHGPTVCQEKHASLTGTK